MTKLQSFWIPAFAGMTTLQACWIPAFAGMTKYPAFVGMTKFVTSAFLATASRLRGPLVFSFQ
jgi:hypothetical protein